MFKYNGKGLTPLFYSEITSSYMLYDIFKNNPEVAKDFIMDRFGIFASNFHVEREKPYPKKGSIDVFLEFETDKGRCALLIEVKVHDYLSATEGQIETYYNAVLDDGVYYKVYFIYLTQFTQDTNFDNTAIPKTIAEAKRGEELIENGFAHISWEQMHLFLVRHFENLSDEQKLITSLQKEWILSQCEVDLEKNKVDVGERDICDYFSDLNIDLKNELPFGIEISDNKRLKWRMPVNTLDEVQLDSIIRIIKKFADSSVVNKTKSYKTDEETILGAKEFLAQLSQSIEDWKLTAFYANLFLYIEKTKNLKFNGTGSKGFSIKLEIIGKGEISLCTIYRNRTIEFSLKR